MPSKLKLYTHRLSGNSFKVKLLASFLSIPLELKTIDYSVDENHQPEFLALNPRGQIPVLVVENGPVLTDSAAILTYLAATYSDSGEEGQGPSSWWSTDIVEQAEIVSWFAFAASWVQSLATARIQLSFPDLHKHASAATPEQLLKDAQAKGKKTLAILESVLSKRQWLAADRPTVADLPIFVYVALAPMGDIYFDEYPAVKDWVGRIRQLPNFIAMEGMDDPMYLRR